ncbi:LAME_0C08306g1_1 [Lachancea meyersii CBS 8951]|uniref:LAME_0C08306g1_1 n=1 Tax=Lachancea meyersii CBS 8951 TaxID=1266667 RepID=A0A1G4J3F6_9SACH|nr:LAME_0C08306g1_1 [Lachancea meyersii CBS 8951]
MLAINSFFCTLSFSALVLGSQVEIDSGMSFPTEVLSNMHWQTDFGSSHTVNTASKGIYSLWNADMDVFINKTELQLLKIYALDSTLGIAEEVFLQCQSLKILSDDILHGLGGTEWEPVRQYYSHILKIQIRSFDSDVGMSFSDATKKSDQLVRKLKQLTTMLRELSVLVENKFAPMEPNYEPDLIGIAFSLDELTVGRIIGEGIAKKVEGLVVGGDLHAAITEVANIFGDLGTLVTAYVTGLALCTSGLAFAMCGVSILLCGGGTVIFICRLFQHLQKVFKVMGW